MYGWPGHEVTALTLTSTELTRQTAVYMYTACRLLQNWKNILASGQSNLVKGALNPITVEGLEPPPNTMCVGSTWVSTPNKTPIRSAVFAGCRCVADRLTDTPRYGIIRRNSPHHAFDPTWIGNAAATDHMSVTQPVFDFPQNSTLEAEAWKEWYTYLRHMLHRVK